jgi:hypothetical protein
MQHLFHAPQRSCSMQAARRSRPACQSAGWAALHQTVNLHMARGESQRAVVARWRGGYSSKLLPEPYVLLLVE